MTKRLPWLLASAMMALGALSASAEDKPRGVLAGTCAGVGATASLGVGANVLVGGSRNSISLQPIPVEGQTGLDIAGGVTTVTLALAQ